ncbi:DHA2 family efflux MFS transporter permease subunit [Tsukamurella soli]|uniref:DHA2 family efflux MFS transporter permease subunit n=1 Tax=Tsukamurella soli TaxID=644556 RepID=A0ABP8JLZ9_9ACTN
MGVPSDVRRWLGLIAIALGVAIVVVDTTIVNVIVPSIIGDLGVDSAQAQWIQESYAIIFAALLLVVGRASDILGARRVFVTGVVVFGLSSLLAGVAADGTYLILARFIQGAGAALILPTSLALLNASFTGKARGQAFAVWGSTIGAAAALGPLLGGWLSEHVSWRWAFGVNIPLTLVILVGSFLFLDRSAPRGGKVDIIGAVLSVTGLGLLAFGLIEGRNYGWVTTSSPARIFGYSWSSRISPVLIAFVLAAALLMAFTLRQRALTRGARPDSALMDVRLFSIGSFRSGNIATLIIGVGEFGIVAVLPLWLQFTLNYSAVTAGLALVPIALGSFVASGASFGAAEKVSPLSLVRIGLALEAIGLAGLALLAATDNRFWHIGLVLFVYGVGVGFATAQVTNVVLVDIPELSSGQASGIQSTFRQLGSALGIAVLTTTFFSALSSTLNGRLLAAGTPPERAGDLSRAVTASAGAAIKGLARDPHTASAASAARDAMTHSLTICGVIATAFLLVGLVSTALIPTGPRDRDVEGATAQTQ